MRTADPTGKWCATHTQRARLCVEGLTSPGDGQPPRTCEWHPVGWRQGVTPEPSVTRDPNPPSDPLGPWTSGVTITVSLLDGRRFRYRRGGDAPLDVRAELAWLRQPRTWESVADHWIDVPPLFIAAEAIASLDVGDLGHEPRPRKERA